jgi:hypothetical protein
MSGHPSDYFYFDCPTGAFGQKKIPNNRERIGFTVGDQVA